MKRLMRQSHHFDRPGVPCGALARDLPYREEQVGSADSRASDIIPTVSVSIRESGKKDVQDAERSQLKSERIGLPRKKLRKHSLGPGVSGSLDKPSKNSVFAF
ncbi:hypothetical protein E5288_WYG005683 [Bos mutus]|uniref:Uncharacterized protein n=1 Tax=Bos mutus TaxID=72004 RepID=A0A6B0RR92_9CETA|nr:hypothetical protein [Bos mutus]